ncbi:MAG: dTDP-4-dehydrorhamnose reductase family protein [Candidatus Hermodarchaeota archaeon]
MEALIIKKILIFGSTGMAGHVITRYLKSINKYEIFDAALNKLHNKTIEINIEDKESVINLLRKIKPDIVINCIGILIKESSEKPALAIYINSFFPHLLAELGVELDFKLIHLSTDCVFSGKRGGYSEDDLKDGEDHYAKTKALGEVINNKDLTFRTSIIGPEIKKNGTGLFHWFMTQKGSINGFTNVYWTGVTTLELAKVIDKAIDQDLSSLYHLVPSKNISKYELLKLINEIWNRNVEILEYGEYYSDKSLINNRNDFDYKIPNYREMLIELYEWMKNWDYELY